VRINEADAETIARTLDGIGITREEAIVNFREIYGDFTSVKDLQLVKDVGEVTLRNNESRILFDYVLTDHKGALQRLSSIGLII